MGLWVSMEYGDIMNNKQYEAIFNDITNICNLRCPFCFNDFSKISKTVFMSEATFKKVLQLLPLVKYKFFFSCSFEPTLHPQFIEFLKMVPKRFRKKVVFTTNLSIDISDNMIQELSQLGIYNINISLDSLNPSMYESLRRGARFEHFINNLERLARVFSKNPKAPLLRYITMVLRQNLDEIPYILERCSRKYLSIENEFRSSYETPHVLEEWKRKNFISNEEWEQLEIRLNKLPYKFSIYRPEKVALYELESPRLFINSEGIVTFHRITEKFNINQISNPPVFLKNLRKKHKCRTSGKIDSARFLYFFRRAIYLARRAWRIYG